MGSRVESADSYANQAVEIINNSVTDYHGFMTNTTRDRWLERERQAANYLNTYYREALSAVYDAALEGVKHENKLTEMEREYDLRNTLAYEQATYTDQVNAARTNYEAALKLYDYQLEHSATLQKTGSNIIVEGAKTLFKLVTK